MIVFENRGEIDPVAISTFGVSVKESENPIGFFGTGLKYALAILLRNKQQVTIHSGARVLIRHGRGHGAGRAVRSRHARRQARS